ncbi:hypothetical protein PS880_05894 [Pseudomonas fluorescens]|uniref:Uncharacterized protein n=1 Tax=Pseudomonas fluorescens TaxID=294 RepID=A0A5E7Q7S1_PSEFL|nr:hypothetical protein PS880_05894 [Pseudomonas fluorescens]
MAHLVETLSFACATPWHRLGNQLTQKQPIEVWQREAGMDWKIVESPVHFKSETFGHLGAFHSLPGLQVFYRLGTKGSLLVALLGL